MTRRDLAVAAMLLLAGCGRVADLKPAPGQALPVKPLMAKSTPTPNELLALPPYAKPDRVDELMKRSDEAAERTRYYPGDPRRRPSKSDSVSVSEQSDCPGKDE